MPLSYDDRFRSPRPSSGHQKVYINNKSTNTYILLVIIFLFLMIRIDCVQSTYPKLAVFIFSIVQIYRKNGIFQPDVPGVEYIKFFLTLFFQFGPNDKDIAVLSFPNGLRRY